MCAQVGLPPTAARHVCIDGPHFYAAACYRNIAGQGQGTPELHGQRCGNSRLTQRDVMLAGRQPGTGRDGGLKHGGAREEGGALDNMVQ